MRRVSLKVGDKIIVNDNFPYKEMHGKTGIIIISYGDDKLIDFEKPIKNKSGWCLTGSCGHLNSSTGMFIRRKYIDPFDNYQVELL